MVRALTVLYPAAARAPIVSGWLPLQLLCQHARNKGDNSHHGVRATPALLSALRAAYPGAATECLPQARKNGLGEKTAESLLPFDLPHREAGRRRRAQARARPLQRHHGRARRPGPRALRALPRPLRRDFGRRVLRLPLPRVAGRPFPRGLPAHAPDPHAHERLRGRDAPHGAQAERGPPQGRRAPGPPGLDAAPLLLHAEPDVAARGGHPRAPPRHQVRRQGLPPPRPARRPPDPPLLPDLRGPQGRRRAGDRERQLRPGPAEAAAEEEDQGRERARGVPPRVRGRGPRRRR
mmetsp:Transcript_24136/g.82944  ORF Transcript_24136/g.82944 Transcript_24136/m.82944 type:complete len:293 (+) Transcript_24136:296-1174(+)